MDRHPHPEELFEFPCNHVFKAFGPNDSQFVEAVHRAVDAVVPVGSDSIKSRVSTGGKYVSVSVSVRLHDFTQLKLIYAELRDVAGLKYLL